jgi:hypothetical protein
MAASSATLPPVSSTHTVHRTDSLGSNVSAGSITSLSRRPRTKGRPRAVTVSSRRDRSPASNRGLEVQMATADELLTESPSLLPTMSPDASPSAAAPSRPPRSPLRVATLLQDKISHPDIVPSPGWKAMDDMESSWRSRAVKIEHSTVRINVSPLLKKGANVRFPSRRAANAGRASPVMPFVCHLRRQGTPMPSLLPSAKCRLCPISPHFGRLASDFESPVRRSSLAQRLLCIRCLHPLFLAPSHLPHRVPSSTPSRTIISHP